MQCYSRELPGGGRDSLTPARGRRVFDGEPRRTRVIGRATGGAKWSVHSGRARGALAGTESLRYPRRQLAELGLPVVRREMQIMMQWKCGGPGDKEQGDDEGLNADHVALCDSSRKLGGW